ncbi:MAG: hypothetical protein QMB62_07585 [Oscillospiraceae bacterium]
MQSSDDLVDINSRKHLDDLAADIINDFKNGCLLASQKGAAFYSNEDTIDNKIHSNDPDFDGYYLEYQSFRYSGFSDDEVRKAKNLVYSGLLKKSYTSLSVRILRGYTKKITYGTIFNEVERRGNGTFDLLIKAGWGEGVPESMVETSEDSDCVDFHHRFLNPSIRFLIKAFIGAIIAFALFYFIVYKYHNMTF